MRIAIDASRTTLARRTGTERYALQLLKELLRLNAGHDFILYFRDRPPAGLLPSGPRIEQRVIPFTRAWTHLRFAGALWTARPDVTFVPAHALPRVFPGPAVVTIHDLGFHHFPDAHSGWPRRYLAWSTRWSTRRASVILADSVATKRDLVSLHHISPEKIRVVYPGVDDALARVDDPAEIQRVRDKYHLPEHYLLFVGTLQPRKNIGRLVQAYAASSVSEDGIALVLAGGKGWLYDPAWTAAIPGVTETGFVDDADLAALYSSALALVFPSLYEGFGFPVLEAMQCGTPVITSTTSSLPEVAGDAAITVDPLETAAIADSIQRVVNDHTLRARLVEAGYAQARRFTWQHTACQTLAALEAAANQR